MRARGVFAFALLFAAALVAWIARQGESPSVEATSPVVRSSSESPPVVARETEDVPQKAIATVSPVESAPEAGEASRGGADVAETGTPASITLYGFVLPPAGRELTGEVGISVTNRLGARQVARPGPDGAYAFGGLAPGPCWVSASSTEGARAKLAIELDAGEPERRLDLRLEAPPEIRVRVVDLDGRPVHGLIAEATLEPPGEWLLEVTANLAEVVGVGRFDYNGLGGAQMPEAYLGRLRLEVEPPVYVSLVFGQRVLAMKRVEAGVDEVEFILDPNASELQRSAIRLRFVDAASGAPIVQGTVLMCGAGTQQMSHRGDEFVHPASKPGQYEIQTQFKGYGNVERRFLVQPGGEQDLGTIALDRALAIAGSVVDDAGGPVSGDLIVRLVDESEGVPARSSTSTRYATASDGSFRIDGLSRGRYFVALRDRDDRWARSGRTIDLARGSVENVRIELARGVPLLVRPSVENARDVRYRILDARGELVTFGRLSTDAPEAIPLAPGAYTVEARVGNAEPVRHTITIASEPVELALP